MRHLSTYKYVDEVAKIGSIRRAAETLSITPSALLRRIQALEEELGEPIFERLARGVRLSAAGEVLIHHIRVQLADMERVKSQIADLAGVRRGHVSIACSQGLMPNFIAPQIELYRGAHSGVTFNVLARDQTTVEQALQNYSADMALVFEPGLLADCETLSRTEQPIHVVMAHQHPLAKHKQLRLKDCLDYPVALASLSSGVRPLLDKAADRIQVKPDLVIESDSFDFLRSVAGIKEIVSFHVKIGLSQKKVHDRTVHRPIDPRDLPSGILHLVKLRERVLPVAAKLFADQLASVLDEEYQGR